jgi:hypothetical protein
MSKGSIDQAEGVDRPSNRRESIRQRGSIDQAPMTAKGGQWWSMSADRRRQGRCKWGSIDQVKGHSPYYLVGWLGWPGAAVALSVAIAPCAVSFPASQKRIFRCQVNGLRLKELRAGAQVCETNKRNETMDDWAPTEFRRDWSRTSRTRMTPTASCRLALRIRRRPGRFPSGTTR